MFNNQTHKDAFLNLCPGKLLNDPEWTSTVYILTCDNELRSKTNKHINPDRYEIHWRKIMATDFGSGHRAALYWAFSLWAGNSYCWDAEGNHTEPVDTMDKAFSMDEDLRVVATIGLMLRWKLKTIKEESK